MRLLGILSADGPRDSALRGVASAGGPLVPRADGALKGQQRADGEGSEDGYAGAGDARCQMEGTADGKCFLRSKQDLMRNHTVFRWGPHRVESAPQ